jgi:hypothetical protein
MRLLSFTALAAALAVSGCSDPFAGRQALSGKVLLNGSPVKDGIIFFDPLENQDTKGSAQVLNGTYTIPREAGLKAGRYLVRLTAGDGKTPAKGEAGKPGGSTNIVSVDLIPPEWGAESKKEISVKADGPNTFDFDVK